MRKLLIEVFSFEPDNIRVLTNERATKEAILDRIRWLIGTAREGDICVFSCSSHGSRVRDRSGDELDDGLDEIICPVDMDWNNPLTDDILGQEFSKLPYGAALTCILDMCHSGTGTRSPSPPKNKIRFLSPPVDIAMRSEGRSLPIKKLCLKRGVIEKDGNLVGIPVKGLRHVLIAGCKSNQTSADAWINGDYHGALTYYLIETIRENPDRTYEEIINEVRVKLLSFGYQQIPQLEGGSDLLKKKIFIQM